MDVKNIINDFLPIKKREQQNESSLLNAEVMTKTVSESYGVMNEYNTCSRLRQLRGQWSREPAAPSDRAAVMTSWF